MDSLYIPTKKDKKDVIGYSQYLRCAGAIDNIFVSLGESSFDSLAL